MDTEGESARDAKRRKVRKGTHSCWACKKRKEKCLFHPDDRPGLTAICIGCQRRGTKCISQEFPEERLAPSISAHQINDRMLRVEALVERLTRNLDRDENEKSPSSAPLHSDGLSSGLPTPASLEPRQVFDENRSRHKGVTQDRDVRIVEQAYRPLIADSHSVNQAARPDPCSERCAALYEALHRAMPSRGDHEIICRVARRLPDGFNDTLTRPYLLIEQHGLRSPEEMMKLPQPDAHPILLARHLLQLAILLQYIHPEEHPEIKQLEDAPNVMTTRMADAAIGVVAQQEKLLGNLLGLECLMLEGLYQANCGNMRTSWLTCRRALSLAHLLGLHKPGNKVPQQVLDPELRADSCHMWFRLNHYDRQVSLMLGMPPGSTDRSMYDGHSYASDTPLGQLERSHCVLISQVLERNESKPTAHSFALTQALDSQLQKAAKCLPSRWWLIPNLQSAPNDQTAMFWETRRIIAQMTHFNLLNQLHLPFMLQSSGASHHAYSKVACMNASREILSRFISLRSLSRLASSCRTADFLAFQASITLLLAHIDSHDQASQEGNFLGHQYLSDRAMVEQAQESMEEVNDLSEDAFSRQTADLLRRLLAIDAAADEDENRLVVQMQEVQDSRDPHVDDGAMRVHIPYFGLIKIARASGISKEDSSVMAPAAQPYTAAWVPGSIRGGMGSTGSHTAGPETPAEPSGSMAARNARIAGFGDSLLPGLTAGADEWTFQGVDTAYFDNLMRGFGEDLGDCERQQ